MKRTIITCIAAAAALVATLACGAGGDTAGPGVAGQAAEGAEHTILFEVTATSSKSADVTFGTGGDTSQDGGAKLPWSKEIKAKSVPFVMSVVAQNKAGGDILCKITVDGEVRKENKSSGQYAVVTCTA
ncbi:hypothetical protein Val02_82200 [Virgisporangium aliadipatigenens]|uniref:MmpS family membrane protein n=1 Tax=Virgisporangium aliadipatigenens TaxID=741659 RepID=A0A8J3YT17_9ACTN|nr:MmpS family transport accessory protein [Virgisporangium aliadipatigenens]GIJ51334.1 hypothetical protein Val02_82200 [Virgisporangium aliadipatigenens]